MTRAEIDRLKVMADLVRFYHWLDLHITDPDTTESRPMAFDDLPEDVRTLTDAVPKLIAMIERLHDNISDLME